MKIRRAIPTMKSRMAKSRRYHLVRDGLKSTSMNLGGVWLMS